MSIEEGDTRSNVVWKLQETSGLFYYEFAKKKSVCWTTYNVMYLSLMIFYFKKIMMPFFFYILEKKRIPFFHNRED